MSTSLIIYLASIADGVRIALFCHIGGFALAAVIFLVVASDSSSPDASKRRMKIAYIMMVLGAISSSALMVIPNGIDIYKIAGVTDQQKASIDASGRILETQKK